MWKTTNFEPIKLKSWPGMRTPFFVTPPDLPKGEGPGDPHLRSSREVIGYHIQAVDDEIGHVEDFIVQDTG
jgi:hypothetical protein